MPPAVSQAAAGAPLAHPPAALGGVMVSKRMIVWNAEGQPVPAEVPVLTKPQIESLSATALSLLYEPEKPGLSIFTTEVAKKNAQTLYDEECAKYAGMTCAEVMFVKLAQKAAAGSLSATTELLDRTLGKPKQSSEVKSFSMKYEDYVKKVAEEEERARLSRGTVTVEVLPPFPKPGPEPSDNEFPGLEDLL